jgi:hypothetical protein
MRIPNLQTKAHLWKVTQMLSFLASQFCQWGTLYEDKEQEENQKENYRRNSHFPNRGMSKSMQKLNTPHN